jgi:hypothetical protein
VARVTGRGFLSALAVLLLPLVPLALAWLLVWITAAFGTTPEALGLHQLVRLLLYLGSAGWLLSVPLGVILAFVAIMRAVKRPKGGA